MRRRSRLQAMIDVVDDVLRRKNRIHANVPQRQVDDSGRVREQLFVGNIGFRRRCRENYQGRVAYSVLQTCLNIGFETVLLPKPLAEPLRLPAVQIVQADFSKCPVSEQEPLDGCARDNPRSNYCKGSLERVGGNMLRGQRGRRCRTRCADQRCLDAGQRITRGGIVQNQNRRRSSQVAGPVFREARNPLDTALLNRTTKMGWQRDDASARFVGISQEVAVRVESVAGRVKAVGRLDGAENLPPMVVNDAANSRTGNDVECRSRWHNYSPLRTRFLRMGSTSSRRAQE